MKGERLRSALGLVPVLLVCYFLQSNVFSRLRIGGIAPLILPMAAVGVGLLGGALWGGAAGLACGILCDAAMGGGLLFTAALTALGFFAGFLGDFVLARGFPSYVLLSVLSLLLCALLQMLRLLFAPGAAVWPLLRTGLLQTLVSLIFILPLYFCIRRALRSLRRSRERNAL